MWLRIGDMTSAGLWWAAKGVCVGSECVLGVHVYVCTAWAIGMAVLVLPSRWCWKEGEPAHRRSES
jgi:hypothetical protein